MPRFLSLALFLTAAVLGFAADRPRLLVLTDMGSDPDDQQSMVRLMVYANEFELEGLIATAAGKREEDTNTAVHPELIQEIVTAYGKVRPNLVKHANRWPTAEDLLKRVKSGNPKRGRDCVGEGLDTEGSRWIIQRVDASLLERPLYITCWGGQTDLAQALWRVKKDRGAAGLMTFVARMRVFDVNDQDKLASYIHSEFPGMFYILAKAQPGHDKREATYRGMYIGGDISTTSREWVEKNILSKGALGKVYPTETWTAPNPHSCLKEGDTPSWFFFLPLGGNDPRDPSKPGWGGQYRRGEDGWFHDLVPEKGADPREAVYRWRPAFQADFAKRMTWCVE